MTEEENKAKEPTWWHKRTKLEKRMFIASGVAFVVVIIIFAVYASIIKRHYNQETNEPESPENITATEAEPSQTEPDVDAAVCISEACTHAASKILKLMDESADPCDNFYQFACGGFTRTAIIPEDTFAVSTTQIIHDLVKMQYRTVLEQPLVPEEPKAFKIVKRLYHLCMDTSGIEADGFKPLHNLLKYLGGWPVLEGNGWKENEFDWKDTIHKFRRSGLSADVFFIVYLDKTGPKGPMLGLSSPTSPLSLATLSRNFNDAHVQDYYRYMVDVAIMLGANRLYAQNELKQAMHFEIELAKIQTAPDKAASKQILKISELQEKFPSVPWLDFFRGAVGDSVSNLTSEEPVFVDDPSYLEGLLALLKRAGKRVQSNYALFYAIHFSSQYLTRQLRDRTEQFLQEIAEGEWQDQPRWRECTDVVYAWLEPALLMLHLRNYFSNGIKGNVTEMIGDIRGQFEQLVQDSNWMDKTTKKAALQKLEAVKIRVAYYPEELPDDETLEQVYKALDADYDSYLSLILKIHLFDNDRYFASLKEPSESTLWAVPVNLYNPHRIYYSEENSIEIPSVALQDVLYDNDRPRYLNYGASGQIIGHELVHAIDETGKEYNKDGIMEKWWTETTENKFYNKETCVIDQYSKVTEPRLKMKLNGTKTKTENIADITGIKLAYMAYNSWLERNDPEPLLPGLDKYSPKQIFWISAASIYCEKRTNELLQKQIMDDFYSPANYRVQLSFANSPDFAGDFECPKGSVMNPNLKCQIW